MHPENLPLIIALVCGLGLGGLVGFLAAACRIHRAVIRRERDTWRIAGNYYKRRYDIAE